ncbi:pyrroline-5-carboxylate reductase [Roseivivax lentus]|uniref:Pyrroline-5-carboxylate reductase n=1 Tax=Roseivivax lentus TaxID=633194 RepID=A0A1N7JTI5_9RHOB|nr:pyrroline-5-carboxylate reductase dimerization domain-containing protein [Roseivivax lentus]SIS52658.1 pyrroline-5-carboxylate reductase [Roseivivax lentus]
MSVDQPIGIIGAGALGGAIATALLDRGGCAPEALTLVTRSGRADAFADRGCHVTARASGAARDCPTILLCVPPASLSALDLHAPDALVLSVVAGLGLARIQAITGCRAAIRAMSSPAAARGLAYSPFVMGPGATEADRASAAAFFGACGDTDEIADEAQIDFFTALTGPVPGFVAFWAECLTDWATARGIPEDVALKAVRQLFRASGTILAEEAATPAAQVDAMIDYAGTTAAGMEVLRASPVAREAARALDASAARARSISDD